LVFEDLSLSCRPFPFPPQPLSFRTLPYLVVFQRNVDVNELNDYLLDRLPGEEHSYKSIDSVATENEEIHGE
jgi:hypothetical protein